MIKVQKAKLALAEAREAEAEAETRAKSARAWSVAEAWEEAKKKAKEPNQ